MSIIVSCPPLTLKRRFWVLLIKKKDRKMIKFLEKLEKEMSNFGEMFFAASFITKAIPKELDSMKNLKK